MSKVSICVPVYGVEKYIERCARSLFEQTMTDGIEFIFVNDCTKDKSIEILEQVLSEYPQRKDQVKIIHHEKNGGLVAARNTGLKHATGDYIIHCDSDDWVDLNMYEAMYNKAIETDADMVYCDYYESDLNNHTLTIKPGTCDPELLMDELLFQNNNRSLCDKLFKRQIALSTTINCPDHIIVGEDLLRVLQMLKLCKNITCISEPYYFYRLNPDSITKAHWKRNPLQSLLDIGSLLPDILEEDKHSAAINFFKCSVLLSMIKHPEAVLPDEFNRYSSTIGIKNIKYAMRFMERQRKIILTIALKNYKLSCVMCRAVLFISSLLKNIKK